MDPGDFSQDKIKSNESSANYNWGGRGSKHNLFAEGEGRVWLKSVIKVGLSHHEHCKRVLCILYPDGNPAKCRDEPKAVDVDRKLFGTSVSSLQTMWVSFGTPLYQMRP